MNQLILGDCLEVLKQMNSESVDLVYLDPPFFSNRTYEVVWGDKGEVRSFEDRFSGGVEHYIAWLKERVQEMHRVLKPTGSIFLHCDWHADAYIRVYILDKIFGRNRFHNQIIWKRADTHNDAKHQLPNISDTIFWYSKSDDYTFEAVYARHAEKTLREWYKYLEYPDGSVRKLTKEEIDSQSYPEGTRRFNTDNMASPNPRPNLMYEYKGYSYPKKGWRYSLETMEKLDAEGKLLFPKNKSGRIMLKRYLDEQKGAVVGDVWLDIDQVRGAHAERIGYPTQKPEALMDRIISMASNEGDVVLDPFVGGGTTVAVADRIGRQWIGIDQSVQAVKVTELRLQRQQDLFSKPFFTKLHKYDYETLRYKDAFEFETWIIQMYGGQTNAKQRGDMGMDGRTREGVPIQVKRSDNIGRNVIDNFFSALQRYDKTLFERNKKEGKPVGHIIAFSFGKGAIQEVARLKNEEGALIQLVTVEEIVPISKKPKLKLTMKDKGTDSKGLRELFFTTEASSDAGIEFFSWDWEFKESEGFRPQVLFDKDGIQTHVFKPGHHTIAVKVVDNDGLEAVEVVRIKVNGEAKREG